MSKMFHILQHLKRREMNRVFLTATFFLIFTSFMSLNGQWAKSYGGSDYDWAHSVHQASDGGYIVLGITKSFGSAYSQSLWIFKLSSAGDVDWQNTYGASRVDHEAQSIQQTMDGGYIVASGGVLKLSPTGDTEWRKTYSGSVILSIQQTMDGDYIVAGNAESDRDGDLDSDFCVLKLSTTGDIEWQKTYGGDDSDYAHSIQQTMDGGYIVADRTNVLKLSPVGDIEWQHSYGIDSVCSVKQTMDGGYIIAGEVLGWFGGLLYSYNLCFLKLSSEGNIEWQKAYGGGFKDNASSIQQTMDGGYIVAGNTGSFCFGASRRDVDFWIFKLSSNGELGPYCGLIKSIDAAIADADLYPEDTNIIPQDTNITAQETNISSETTNAHINDFSSGKYILCIKKGEDGTTDPSAGIHIYEPGTKVPIKAMGDLSRWLGGDVPEGKENDNPIIITMDSHKSIMPNFWGTVDLDYFFGEGCFIATAAYGTPLHPHIEILRDFRDKYLISSRLGRKFVDLYYKYSPFIANIVAKHKALKVAAQIHLFPLVIFSYSMVHLGPMNTAIILAFILMIQIFLISFFRKSIRTTD